MKSIIPKDVIQKSITIKNGKEVVRSDVLAKVFEKQHKHILAKIKSEIVHLLIDEGYITGVYKDGKEITDFSKIDDNTFNNLLAGFPANKLNKYFIAEKVKRQGGETIRYYLTRIGFDLVALSLTGKNARKYKRWYIEAFHDKQRVIEEHKLTAKLNYQNIDWVQWRESTKEARLNLTDAINEYIVKYRKDVELKENDGQYFTNYTKLIYKKLGIDLPKGTNVRDVLDKKTLVKLTALEYEVADMIEKYSKEGLYYKDVYKKIKKELEGNVD